MLTYSWYVCDGTVVYAARLVDKQQSLLNKLLSNTCLSVNGITSWFIWLCYWMVHLVQKTLAL